MMSCCNSYFEWYVWKDFEKYETRNLEMRQEKEYVVNHFNILQSRELLYFQAQNKSNWFGEPEHEIVWNVVRNIVQDIQGRNFKDLYIKGVL